jgi:hypothetical protein
MKLLLTLALFAFALAGCMLDKSDESTLPPASEWDGYVQDHYPLISQDSGRLQPDRVACDSDWANVQPILYRLHQDTLELGWTNITLPTAPNEDTVVILGSVNDTLAEPDTFLVAGVYTRSTRGNGIQGGWKLVRYRAWNSGVALSTQEAETLDEWNFLYQDEEAFIGPKILYFAYPKLWVNSLRSAEYRHRDDAEPTFQYIGKDSLYMSRAGETVGVRYKPFQFFRANSSLESHEPINVDLTDSCDFVGDVIDTTWVQSFLWNLNEKRAASGRTWPSSKFAFKHR